jgi:hypothetical protein
MTDVARRPRRRHPARGARTVVTWASAGAVLAITAALGFGHRATAEAPSGPAPGIGRDATVPGTGSPGPAGGGLRSVPPATPGTTGTTRSPDFTTHGSH